MTDGPEIGTQESGVDHGDELVGDLKEGVSLEQRGLGTGWDLTGKQLKPLIQTIRKARVLQSSLLLTRGRAKKIKTQYIDSTSPSALLGGSSWNAAYPDIPTCIWMRNVPRGSCV